MPYDENGLLRTSPDETLIRFSPTAIGWSGVQLFLLISGFLIHGNYLKNKEQFQLGTYVSKRFWRIYPPYLLTLLATILILEPVNYYLQDEHGQKSLITHILLIHNLFEGHIYAINPSLWSLALEAQLYILFPFFLLLRQRIGINKAFLVTVGVAVLWIFYQEFFTNGVYKNANYFSVLSLWYNWCAGALLAEKKQENKEIFLGKALYVCLVAMIIFWGSRFFRIHYYLQLPAVILFWLALMEWYLKRTTLSKNFATNTITKLGLCSYSFYLIHQPFTTKLFSLADQFTWGFLQEHSFVYTLLKTVISFTLLFVIAWILFRSVELTSIRIGQRFRKRDQF